MPRNQRPTNVAYYAKNRSREIRRVRDRQNATVRFLRAARAKPCADCGGRFEPHQMDFDHRDPATQSFNLMTGRASLMSTDRLLGEMVKCDIVCANCHRIRSWKAHQARMAIFQSTARSRYIDGKRSRSRMHARVLDELRAVPCADCGERFPACAMDFIHRDASTKTTGVTRMVGRASLDRIMVEVVKCDIVCANCHRLRTYRRRTPERE